MIASFVMILGYGIIAVPTGIVTAEYSRVKKAKSLDFCERHLHKEDEDNKVDEAEFCHRCDHKTHQKGAKFCCNCGALLRTDYDDYNI